VVVQLAPGRASQRTDPSAIAEAEVIAEAEELVAEAIAEARPVARKGAERVRAAASSARLAP
jgi:hypothetical protein